MQNINILVILALLAGLGIVVIFLLKKSKIISSKQNSIRQIDKVKAQNSLTKPLNENSDVTINDKKKLNKKKKKSKEANQTEQTKIKSQKQIQQIYSQIFYGSINLKPQQNAIHYPVSLAFKNSKILVSNTKNQLILYDLKRWKKDDPKSLQKNFVSLDNNTATSVCIGKKYYYAALNFDKTIVYFQFLGEKGEYFRQIKRFNRNILKSDASSIYAGEGQMYIITSGSQADATINIWSMKGEKIQSFNTYQIQHYDIQYCLNTIMVRGWTSEVKLFEIQSDKMGNFLKIQKSYHLGLQDQPICASIDNLGLYSITVSKTFQIILWDIKPKNASKMQLKITEPYQIQLDTIDNCLIHTLKNQNERYKTIIVLSGDDKIVICDRHFNVLQFISGIDSKSLSIIGSVKNIVLINRNKSQKLYVWNLTKIVEQKFEQYAL